MLCSTMWQIQVKHITYALNVKRMVSDLLVCVCAGRARATLVAERCVCGGSSEHLHEGGMSLAGSEGRARCDYTSQ